MEIQKVFSNVENGEEKLYSVLMSEDEISLYSQFQKEFARRDYEGLTGDALEQLKSKRSRLAKELLSDRADILEDVDFAKKKGKEVVVGASRDRNKVYRTTMAPEEAKKSLYNKSLKDVEFKAEKARRDALMQQQLSNRATKEKARIEQNIANNAKKNRSYLDKGLNFAKNHKLGMAGAGLATAGTAAYLYNKKKNKEN